MHLPGSARRRVRSLAVIVAVLVAATGPAALAGAASPTTGPDHGVGREEMSDLVADMLAALGVAAERVDTVVTPLASDVADRLNEMVDEGVLAVEQVEELEARLDEGGLLEASGRFVEDTRLRRDAFHHATRAVLAGLGIDVPDDVRLEDVLRANEVTLADLRDLLVTSGLALPPPPTPRPDPTAGSPVAGPDDDPPPEPYPTVPPPPAPVAPPSGPYPDTGPTLGDPPTPPPSPSAETDAGL